MHPFWSWWQELPFNLSPYIFEAGPIRLHWYGFMYVVAFSVAYLLAWHRIRKGEVSFDLKTLQDFMTWAVLGVVIGGRLGYAVFYAPEYFLLHPLELVLPFNFSGGSTQFVGIAGMSYHGGLIGLILATVWFAKKRRLSLRTFIDGLVPVVPLGFMFGRIGNFINGELYGRATDAVWGMHFPRDASGQLRHPSQLYEAFLEGFLAFLVLWPIRNLKTVRGHLLALYLILYGIARFFVEFLREPDAHLGFIFGSVTQGQLLSILTVIGGIMLLIRNNLKTMFWDKWFKKDKKEEAPKPEMKEEAPAAAPAEKPADDHSHDNDEDKKICEFC